MLQCILTCSQYFRWAGEPDLADGRVFLFDGQLHLLPPCSAPGDLSPYPVGVPDPLGAAMFIKNYPHLSLADNEVQKVMEESLFSYSNLDAENFNNFLLLF